MKAKLLVPVLLLAAACGEEETTPLDARTAALAADANFRRVAGELGSAVAFLQDSPFLPACDPDAYPDDGGAPCDPLDPDAQAKAIADFLATRIFTEANVESEDGRSVTFRLRPEVVCEPADESCTTLLETLPLRLRATSDQPGDIDVALLVGADRINPLDLALHRDEVELQADLGAVRALLALLGAPETELPAVMEGRVGLGIARHAAGDFTASLSILEAVRVHSGESGPWQLELARAFPAVAARVKETERRVSLRLGLSALALRGPIDAFFGEEDEPFCDDCAAIERAPIPTGTIGISLAGLTGEAIVESAGRAADVLRLQNIGLGNETSVIDADGAPLLTIDLNPLAGRAFDLVATAGEDGMEIEFQPAFDLGLGFFFANIADRVAVAEWALEETLRIRVDGAAAPRLRLPAMASDAGLVAEVLEGMLTLESSSLQTVEVAAGMCLAESEAEIAHPFAGYAATTCG